ncbi:RNA polymerase recycling motor HelD [Metabacillus sp. RGM 3146]|uniref:RNA polymerase recycling motor HelD n=1 Tax=Metabacillus sp. RGM 3146 TaxID=3401092 RepID=UPI003B9D1F0E
MSSWEMELEKEERRVNQIAAKISQRLEHLQQETGEVKTDIIDIRKTFWEDVKVNVDSDHEAAETAAAIRQQAELLSEREQNYRLSEKQIRTLQRLQKSPYFARIDFKENDERESEQIYLGINSFQDAETDTFLIYDWRAPISSVYYDFGVGPASYEAHDETIEGEVTLKRQYIIRNGKMNSMFDTGITIGDELLQEVLGKNADSKMKSIVATIQKEQNQIIRNEKSRLLIVQGAAGSGKTSAALQRVAYLLYRYRETLNANDIVLFSPNQMFNSYVSTVLPELGEENMQQTTFQEYLDSILGSQYELEDPLSQAEALLSSENEPGYKARIQGIQYKASKRFMDDVESYANSLMMKGLVFKNISFRGERLISAEEISSHFYNYSHTLPVSNRMKLTAEWLLSQLKMHEIRQREKAWVEEEIQLLDKETYIRHYQEIRKNNQYTDDSFDDFEKEKEVLSGFVVQKKFKPLRKRVKNLAFLNIQSVYQKLFDRKKVNPPAYWKEIVKFTIEKLQGGKMPYEDATPFAYLEQRLKGFRIKTSVRHVFIDEAQDYSLFQLSFIKNTFPNSKLTVLGDISQCIFAHSPKQGLMIAKTLFKPDETEVIELFRSYRSTKTILNFTKEMSDQGERIIPFNRDGKLPSVHSCKDSAQLLKAMKKYLAKLKAGGHQTIAVICKTAKECLTVHEALGEDVKHRVVKETAPFEEGVAVIPSYLSKGVEFDAVIVYEASKQRYGKDEDRKLLYTVCTRAMHELHVFYTDELSPFIASISKEKYHLIKN